MARQSVRPNVVLITIESLRADFVGYLNSQERNTPFLDTLANNSFVYKNAIAPGIPTFFHLPCLLTGKMSFAYGYRLGIANEEGNKTIAEVLQQYGYKTIAVLGDNPQLYSIYNFDRGFDVFLDGFERTSTSDMFLINTLWNIKQRMPKSMNSIFDFLRSAITILSGATPNHISGKELNQKIFKLLPKDNSQPFFLWIHYMDAHFPYLSGIDRIHGLFQKIFFFKRLIGSITVLKIDDAELIELIKEAYRGGISLADEAIRELYTSITASNPNTIFVITSDHGEAFMEHRMFGHEACALYDELIKVPLFIHLPSGEKKVVKNIVSTTSLAKTICSLLDIKHKAFLGSDITKTYRDSPVNHVSRILYNCISPAIRLQIFDNETEISGFNELVSYTTSTYKYIVEIGGKIEELYNLKRDPREQRNLIHQVSKSILLTFRKKVQKVLQ